MLIEFDLQASPGIGGAGSRTLGRTGRALLANPLITAPLAGFALDLSGFGLPAPLLHLATLLGDAASPCALVTIGLFLATPRTAPEAEASVPAIARLVAIKLLLQPALTGLIVWRLAGLPPMWTASAVLIAALPTGTGPFMLAKLYDREAASISGTILVSTLLSVVSITLLAAWLR